MWYLSYMWLNTVKAFAYEIQLVSLAFRAVVTLKSLYKPYVKTTNFAEFLEFFPILLPLYSDSPRID